MLGAGQRARSAQPVRGQVWGQRAQGGGVMTGEEFGSKIWAGCWLTWSMGSPETNWVPKNQCCKKDTQICNLCLKKSFFDPKICAGVNCRDPRGVWRNLAVGSFQRFTILQNRCTTSGGLKKTFDVSWASNESLDGCGPLTLWEAKLFRGGYWCFWPPDATSPCF